EDSSLASRSAGAIGCDMALRWSKTDCCLASILLLRSQAARGAWLQISGLFEYYSNTIRRYSKPYSRFYGKHFHESTESKNQSAGIMARIVFLFFKLSAY